MATTVSESQTNFAQTIANEKEAAEALSQVIGQQNAVFIGFCNALVSEALGAMSKLSAMDMAIANSSKKESGDAKKNAAEATDTKAQAQIAAKVDAKAAATPTPNPPSGGSTTKNIEDTFVTAIGESMLNAVNAQKNMYILAQAATTELISTIVSMTTTTLATTIAKKEK